MCGSWDSFNGLIQGTCRYGYQRHNPISSFSQSLALSSPLLTGSDGMVIYTASQSSSGTYSSNNGFNIGVQRESSFSSVSGYNLNPYLHDGT